MAYIKFKELTKYFDFKREVNIGELPEYTLEYVDEEEKTKLRGALKFFSGERNNTPVQVINGENICVVMVIKQVKYRMLKVKW